MLNRNAEKQRRYCARQAEQVRMVLKGRGQVEPGRRGAAPRPVQSCAALARRLACRSASVIALRPMDLRPRFIIEVPKLRQIHVG
jgi:hypothetical protein